MGAKSALASFVVRVVNTASRVSGRGQGTVAGGRMGLAVDKDLLSELTDGRAVVLVTGTNGKTTTTALLAAALGSTGERVASNSTGSNMPPGHVAALVADHRAPIAVLETDEAYVPSVAAQTNPQAIVLLNLSRDQLDRMSEVRMVAERWRTALGDDEHTTVVANADDPLVVFAASSASHVCWVAGGLAWQADATGCPACGGHIAFGPKDEWHCEHCELARPAPTWWRKAGLIHGPPGEVALLLSLPGQFNRDNALMAAAAAVACGAPLDGAVRAMASVKDVAGRFVRTRIDGQDARLMLAKNPAGWSALLELVSEGTEPVVVSINARTADGQDPSWLWDVDFSCLAGRRVVATGDRWRDLSVRLHYAGVEHMAGDDPRRAVVLAGASSDEPVEVIGNYTAFQDLAGAR